MSFIALWVVCSLIVGFIFLLVGFICWLVELISSSSSANKRELTIPDAKRQVPELSEPEPPKKEKGRKGFPKFRVGDYFHFKETVTFCLDSDMGVFFFYGGRVTGVEFWSKERKCYVYPVTFDPYRKWGEPDHPKWTMNRTPGYDKYVYRAYLPDVLVDEHNMTKITQDEYNRLTAERTSSGPGTVYISDVSETAQPHRKMTVKQRYMDTLRRALAAHDSCSPNIQEMVKGDIEMTGILRSALQFEEDCDNDLYDTVKEQHTVLVKDDVLLVDE